MTIKEDIGLYTTNFWRFVRDCLGHDRNESLGWGSLSREHFDLCQVLQRLPCWGGKHFKLVMMPRFSLKSCICTVAFSLWRIVQNPNLRILIYSESATRAQGFLDGIKSHILGKAGNSKFREVFGSMETTPQTGRWNESQIIVAQRNSSEKEPTVDTGGIESGKIGMHYDIIIFDDIVSDMNVTTKAQLDKVWDCYKKSLSLLKPGGEIIVVGTRWHFGDAYGRMLEEAKNTGDWEIFIKQAEVSGEYPFASTGLTKEFVEAQRARMGSYLFSCLMQNNPVDSSTALFKAENFRFYGNDLVTDNLFITATCDPAGDGDDFTALTVVGTDKDMRMFVLDAVNRHYQLSQIVSEIIRLSYKWNFQVLGIETNFYEGALEKELNLALEEERSNQNFRPFSVESFRARDKVGEGKWARVCSLQPYHERGHVVFPGRNDRGVEQLTGVWSDLAFQMMQRTADHEPLHDDLLDSLAYHIKLIRRGYGEAQKKIPENTIAHIIKQEEERMNAVQHLLPRKYRRFVSSFID